MNRDKLKIYAVVAVLALCLIWLAYYTTTLRGGGYGPPAPLNTPAWTDANELSKKLTEDKRFMDVALSVESETPRKYKVIGLVHTRAELAALKELLSREVPDAELIYEVNLPN